jgi:hypothetical protein
VSEYRRRLAGAQYGDIVDPFCPGEQGRRCINLAGSKSPALATKRSSSKLPAGSRRPCPRCSQVQFCLCPGALREDRNYTVLGNDILDTPSDEMAMASKQIRSSSSLSLWPPV